MKKLLFGLLSVVSLIQFVPPLWAHQTPTLSAQVQDDGSIYVYDQQKEIAHVMPQLFLKGWKAVFFTGTGQKDKIKALAQLPDGSEVSYQVSVQAGASTLKVHAVMRPLQDVSVLDAREAVFFPYQDWQGDSYTVDNQTAALPQTVVHASGGVLASTDGSISIGPSHLGGLTVQLKGKKLHGSLQDVRQWTPQLSVFYTGREPGTEEQPWKAGEKKVFDCTLTFNRKITMKSVKKTVLWGDSLLTTQVLAIGEVGLYKNSENMGYVQPQIFTDGWKIVPFKIQAHDPRFDAVASLPLGGKVGLTFSQTITGSSLHVHYRMTPLQDVTVISSRAAFYLTYKDWFNAPYQVGPVTGRMPAEVQKGFVITKSDAQPITLGPVQPKDLTVRISTDKLTTTLEDDRSWGPYFSFTMNHDEPTAPWVWKAGEVKDLDFTISFNRYFTPQPVSQPPAKPGDITGYWYGTSDIHRTLFRAGSLIQKKKNGTYQVFSGEVDDEKNKVVPEKVTLHGRALMIESTDPNDGKSVAHLVLDKTGSILAGTIQFFGDNPFLTKGEKYPVQYKRGLNYVVSRLDSEGRAVTDYTYQIPQTFTDGWTVGDLKESSLDPQIVEKGVREILAERFPHIQSLLLVQHSRLLLDEYFEGFGPGDYHQMQSTSKSIFSLLFGIGYDQGLVNPDEKLYDFFPEYRKKPDWDPRKDKITLGTILSMTSGFACDDFVPETDCHQIMWSSPDWLDFVLSQPMNHDPGEHWAYCNDCLEPPGAILARQSRMSVSDFAQKYLFGPMGFQNYSWFKAAPNGLTEIAGSISLRPRDMAKLGEMILRKGKWNGQRIVSENWLEQCTKPQAPPPPEDSWWDGYGYLFWRKQMPYKNGTIQVIFTAGRGGQYIFMVPDLDLVCVMTGGNYDDWKSDLLEQQFFKSYILGAVK